MSSDIPSGVSELHRWADPVKDASTSFIGRVVEVSVDRQMGTPHPKHGFTYPVNYGFVPGTMSGDGEEIDAYVLGVDRPIDRLRGRCVAVIRRNEEDDDKLVVIPEDQVWDIASIREAIYFQEQFFTSEILTEKTTNQRQAQPGATDNPDDAQRLREDQ